MISSSVSPMPATIPDLVSSGGRARESARSHTLARAAQQPERPLVVALDAHARLDAPAGLDVVVEDVGPASSTSRSASSSRPRKSGVSTSTVAPGSSPAQRAHGAGPVLGAAIGQVVAVDRGDDDVAQAHARGGRGDLARLERVERIAALARVDGAVAAGARAGVAHDLERRGAAAPALADVRAAGLLADRVQAVASRTIPSSSS